MTSFVKSAAKMYTPEPRLDTSKLPLLDLSSLPKTTLMQTLGRTLLLRRDYGSMTEARFVAWLCDQLPITMIDGCGNVHVDMRSLKTHRTMFTAHTDTVHSNGGVNPVHVDGNFWRASKDAALGADDGAGVALLCHMIEHEVPGYYVFFRGEECGGIGSAWLAENMVPLFADFDRAVAFDRAGYCDVITHQSGGRCCSDEFANALAAVLSTETDWFLPDSTGVYTDTAEFTELVPECTNVSVGYKNQHGDREELNVDFLVKLSVIVLNVLWDELPTARDPKKIEHSYRYSRSTYVKPGDYSGIYTGSRDWLHEAYPDEEVEVDPVGEAEEFELAVMCAIEDAQEGDFCQLLELIGNEAYPEDPLVAERMLESRLLTPSVLESAMQGLDDGYPPGQVLLALFDKGSRT